MPRERGLAGLLSESVPRSCIKQAYFLFERAIGALALGECGDNKSKIAALGRGADLHPDRNEIAQGSTAKGGITGGHDPPSRLSLGRSWI